MAVLEHEVRSAAAKLKDRLLQHRTRLARHRAAGRPAPGKCHRSHQGMLDHRSDLLTADQKRSEQLLGEACLTEDLFDCKGAPEYIACMFQYAGVAGHEPSA